MLVARGVARTRTELTLVQVALQSACSGSLTTASFGSPSPGPAPRYLRLSRLRCEGGPRPECRRSTCRPWRELPGEWTWRRCKPELSPGRLGGGREASRNAWRTKSWINEDGWRSIGGVFATPAGAPRPPGPAGAGRPHGTVFPALMPYNTPRIDRPENPSPNIRPTRSNMTTNPAAQAAHGTDFGRLPDPPEPEDMNNFKYLHAPGNTHHLVEHFGNQDTTILTSDAYISRVPTSYRQGLFHPDLLIAFNVDPEGGSDRTATSSRSRASPRTSSWKSPRAPLGDGTSPKSGMAMPPWASRNTGASTTPAGGITGRPWPATGWLTAFTNLSPSNGLTTGLTRDTARRWTCTCAGKMESSAGMTRPPDGTSPGSETSGTGPTRSRKPARRLKPKSTLSGTGPTPSGKPVRRPKPGPKPSGPEPKLRGTGPRWPKPGPGISRRNSRDASNPEHLELRTGAAGIWTARRLQAQRTELPNRTKIPGFRLFAEIGCTVIGAVQPENGITEIDGMLPFHIQF